ncbi:MAG: hypothetical protein ABIR47_02980 [Candidatus Kapaibacterium sp.]
MPIAILLSLVLWLPAVAQSEDSLGLRPIRPNPPRVDRLVNGMRLELDRRALARVLAGDRFDPLLGAVLDSAFADGERESLATTLLQRFRRMMPAGKHLEDYFIGRPHADRVPDSLVAARVVERVDSVLQVQIIVIQRRLALAGAPNVTIRTTRNHGVELFLTGAQAAKAKENRALIFSPAQVALYTAHDNADAVRLLRAADAALMKSASPSSAGRNRRGADPFIDLLVITFLTENGTPGTITSSNAGSRLPKASYSFNFIGDSVSRFIERFNLPALRVVNSRYAVLPPSGYRDGRHQEGEALSEIFLVDRTPAMVIQPVRGIVDSISPMTGQPEIAIELSVSDAKRFSDLTAANIGRRIIIAIDGEVIMAPVVRSAIPNGRLSIAGVPDERVRKLLVWSLTAGSLSVPMKITEEYLIPQYR